MLTFLPQWTITIIRIKDPDRQDHPSKHSSIKTCIERIPAYPIIYFPVLFHNLDHIIIVRSQGPAPIRRHLPSETPAQPPRGHRPASAYTTPPHTPPAKPNSQDAVHLLLHSRPGRIRHPRHRRPGTGTDACTHSRRRLRGGPRGSGVRDLHRGTVYRDSGPGFQGPWGYCRCLCCPVHSRL